MAIRKPIHRPNLPKHLSPALRAAGAFLLGALLLSACSAIQSVWPAGTPNPLGNAQPTPTPNDQTITIYTSLTPEQVAFYEPYFEQAHPNIKVNLQFGDEWELVRQVINQRENPQVDVLWGLSAPAMVRLQAEGLLEPYQPTSAEAIARLEQVILRMRDTNTPPYWVGFDAFMSAFCVNTQVLAQENLPMPTSWLDLLNPAYAGKLLMPEPLNDPTGYMTVSGLVQIFNSQYPKAGPLLEWAAMKEVDGEKAAWAYLAALNQNIMMYTASAESACAYAARGDVPIAISYGAAALAEIRAAESSPIIAVFPQEGSGWEVQAVALGVSPAPKPAATVFMDWVLSEKAMQLYASYYPITSISTNTEPPIGYISNPLKQLIPNDLVWAGANYERITAQWHKLYESKTESEETLVLPDAQAPAAPLFNP